MKNYARNSPKEYKKDKESNIPYTATTCGGDEYLMFSWQ